ncbi:hypothetical protein [Heliothis virescens ascovirus 3h]|uniref:Uncharacterized protein n=1 Tax=Heliothis virescens ascovirus 3h TaxID=1268039 RepID=A0A386JAH8_9VIRU|nr:hypothetical protein [Heliothis virescens ascovirus 3h]
MDEQLVTIEHTQLMLLQNIVNLNASIAKDNAGSRECRATLQSKNLITSFTRERDRLIAKLVFTYDSTSKMPCHVFDKIWEV